MYPTAQFIKTLAGTLPAPLDPAFKTILAQCQTNEDLFKLVEPTNSNFINPDAFNEVDNRGLLGEYIQWKIKQTQGENK
ncbi:MAG: hypothetical protein ACOC2E_00090 [Bacteroidota bacterium]